MIDQITPLLITFNEEANIRRTLDSLRWASQILVIDSFSTDSTVDLLKQYPMVRFIQREFDSFADQCNFGLEQITTPWVLSLDADHIVSKELSEELSQLHPPEHLEGYTARFKYCIFGRPIRSGILPERLILFRKECAQYRNDGHAHRAEVAGKLTRLKSFLFHDDRKPLDRFLESQKRYAIIEAKKLLSTSDSQLSAPDWIRKRTKLAPILVFFYCLVIKGGILDGKRGLFYAYQRLVAETILALFLAEAQLTFLPGPEIEK